jgi:hypothetical protein
MTDGPQRHRDTKTQRPKDRPNAVAGLRPAQGAAPLGQRVAVVVIFVPFLVFFRLRALRFGRQVVDGFLCASVSWWPARDHGRGSGTTSTGTGERCSTRSVVDPISHR